MSNKKRYLIRLIILNDKQEYPVKDLPDVLVQGILDRVLLFMVLYKKRYDANSWNHLFLGSLLYSQKYFSSPPYMKYPLVGIMPYPANSLLAFGKWVL